MNIGKTLYVIKREEWREWLEKNYDKKKEIWLVQYTKASGKPSLEYFDALDEALCFGWIDSIVKKVDEYGRAQRYSPRKPGSPISELNKHKLRRLIKQDKVVEPVLIKIKDELGRKFVFPKDIIEEIKKNKTAWVNFQKFPKHYKVIRIAFIQGARKRPEEYQRRFKNFIKMTEQNKMFGRTS